MLLGAMCVLACVAVRAEEAIADKIRAASKVIPKTYDAPEFKADGVRALFYDGPPFQGKPTRVFAWYGAPKVEAGKKLPAMVLVHGGGGTAFETWVQQWNKRGYAAIAMDLCGCVPIGAKPNSKFANIWKRLDDGAPAGWGGFGQIDAPLEDQWTFHAASDIILAHSLIRSFPEVDPERIGITGISWGGYLTCVVSGLDNRFKFAVPVYGCGFLGDNSTWLNEFEKMGPERAKKWLSNWDPSVYLKESTLPTLWVTGTNDFAYPMDSLQKSYRLPKAPRTLCIKVRMPHGHGGAGENPEEILAYAESFFNGGKPLATVADQGRKENDVWVTYKSDVPIIKAELNFTCDTGIWKQRKWETIPASPNAAEHKASARLPAGAKVYYLNLIDERGLIVSSEHVEVQ
jgi:dienelactone hydrolase